MIGCPLCPRILANPAEYENWISTKNLRISVHVRLRQFHKFTKKTAIRNGPASFLFLICYNNADLRYYFCKNDSFPH